MLMLVIARESATLLRRKVFAKDIMAALSSMSVPDYLILEQVVSNPENGEKVTSRLDLNFSTKGIGITFYVPGTDDPLASFLMQPQHVNSLVWRLTRQSGRGSYEMRNDSAVLGHCLDKGALQIYLSYRKNYEEIASYTFTAVSEQLLADYLLHICYGKIEAELPIMEAPSFGL